MSADIMPDMYRHTARKSTVSKTLKSSANLPLCNTSTTHYATYNNNNNNHNHNDNESKQEPVFDAIECHIKLEEDSPQQPESFLIIPDNETEQMIIEEVHSPSNEDVISDIIEQILNQITHSSIDMTVPNITQISRTISLDTQDVHNVLDSIMNQVDENDITDFLTSYGTNRTEPNVHNSVGEITPMECGEQVSIMSRSQIDDDIVEIDATSNEPHSHSCTCHCHKSVSSLNNDYLQFEQALKQARQKQQQEKLLNSNHLIQTLKRQHEELINLYQQNKTQKSLNITKTDREQQTLKLNVHDSQIQTDLIQNTNNKLTLQQQKSTSTSTLNSPTTSNNHISQITSRNCSGVYNSIPASSNSTIPQQSPRLPVNTTTTTNKKSTVTTKSTITTNGQSNTPSPSTSSSTSTNTSHDIVDLTEEEDDEDETTSRVSSNQRIVPTRQQSTSATHLPTASSSSTTTATSTATTTTTRIRPINRAIRPNNTTSNGQTFPLRPLPEHVPCDHSISRPQLGITQENATVRLTWNLPSTPMESIQNYEIFAYKQNATVTASDWKKIGIVKSMRLPMAVTLKEFQSNSHYAFAVRAVSITNTTGPFCEPRTIFTGNAPIQPLHTSQLLNVPTS